MSDPVIIGSERSEVGLPAGMAILRDGGSALDAVEAALRRCEDNVADHYVGTGGLPNARGEVELDASVMVGSTRGYGAVAAVRGYPNPISIARAVLETLPQHALLVGDGAELFAAEQGFERAELLTPEARDLWLAALAGDVDTADSVEGEDTAATDGDARYRAATRDLARRLAPDGVPRLSPPPPIPRLSPPPPIPRLSPPDGPWGTINVLALDATGELVVGVSTSGYPYKYPGRVGDSAVPGAGSYCDLRHGGAACTGRGELAMRVTGARQIVDRLAAGADPGDACAAMLADAASVPDEFRAELRCLALTPDGRHGAAAGQTRSVYAVMTSASTDPEIRPRRPVF